jgi:SAM-dependent methyltransferase
MGILEPAEHFSPTYYRWQARSAEQSAQVVVPLVAGLLAPRSVVDVGCGTGAWLAAFVEAGATDVLGIDGSYIDPSQLLIPPERFLGHDLRKQLKTDRRFDLALSLEVAQYLPPSRAGRFVETLTALAPAVLFSSAIPHQPDSSGNGQWPEHWCALFAKHGYVAYDWLRPQIWCDDRVHFWYAQNTLLYLRPEVAEGLEGLHAGPILPLVHPKLYLTHAAPDAAPANRVRKAARRYALRLSR